MVGKDPSLQACHPFLHSLLLLAPEWSAVEVFDLRPNAVRITVLAPKADGGDVPEAGKDLGGRKEGRGE